MPNFGIYYINDDNGLLYHAIFSIECLKKRDSDGSLSEIIRKSVNDGSIITGFTTLDDTIFAAKRMVHCIVTSITDPIGDRAFADFFYKCVDYDVPFILEGDLRNESAKLPIPWQAKQKS